MRVMAGGLALVAAGGLALGGGACRADQTAPDLPPLEAAVQNNPLIHVTPDGASQTLLWFAPASQVFTVKYDYIPPSLATLPTVTLQFRCLAEGNVQCTALDRTSATLTSGQSVQVRVDYTAEMPGSGRVVLSAEQWSWFAYSVADQGDVNLTIQRPVASGGEIQITPDNAQATVYANGTGRYAFQVRYPFLPFVGPQTVGLVCRSTGNVTCLSLSHNAVTLSPGQTQTVYADYATGAPGSGYLVVARPWWIAWYLSEGGDVLLTSVPRPPPLGAFISGPTQVQKGATCSWMASAWGGTPPYRYSWTWGGTSVGTGESLSLRILVSDELRLTVWDSSPDIQTAQATLAVNTAAVTGCGFKQPLL